MATVYILSSKGFIEGESYVINKPDNINEFPHWNEKFMDVLDGETCVVIKVHDGIYDDRTECVVDVDFPEEHDGHRRTSCTLAPSWVSKVSDNELEETSFDVSQLF